jgi:Protein of unknown function (DUF732)
VRFEDGRVLLSILAGPSAILSNDAGGGGDNSVGRERRNMSLRIDRFATHLQRWIVAPLVPWVAALAFATAAYADDQGFLNDLRSSGMPVMYEPYYVGLGYKICAQLGAGMSTADAASQLGIEGQIWGPQIVSAAQHELCPKTLPAP